MEPPKIVMSFLDRISLLFRKKYALVRKPSQISGLGLFTNEFISNGTIFAVSTDTVGGLQISSMFNDEDFIYPSEFKLDTLIQTLENYKNSDKSNVLQIQTHSEDFYIYKARRDINPNEELTRKYGIQKWSFWLSIHISLEENIIHVDDLKTINTSKTITDDTDDKKQSVQNTKIQALIDAWNHFGYTLRVTHTPKS